MALQYWYEVYYEKKLFGDRRHLYNLLMFIANTKQQEKTDAQIRNMLLSKGWSSERITYAINKSVGKRTGMPQLIPFDKIQNLFRKKKAKKQMQASGSAVVGAPHPGILPLRRGYPEDGITNGKQQSWGNINKSSFQNEGKRR
jgi:hypothetical protein